MRECMIPDLVTLAINSRGDITELLRLDSNQEKCRRRMLALEHIENLRRPLRVRPIIKRERHAIRTRSIASDAVGFRQRIEALVGDLTRIAIDREAALAIGRPSFD